MKYLITIATFFSLLFAKEAPEPQSVVILGGGVGALTSAVYLGRAGIQPIVIEGKNPGGAITQSHALQNWPSELEIAGPELAERMKRQAEANGAEIWESEVLTVNLDQRPFQITLRSMVDGSEKTIATERLIIAMGAQPNFLAVPGESEYWGKGVSNCAVCDGSLYRDQVVGVVGGGDGAVLEADYLSNLAREVHLFVRKDAFRGVETVRLANLLEKPNVKVHFQTTVEKVTGDGEKVTGVFLKQDGEESPFALDGLFLGIGSTPNTQIFKGSLELDERGYIVLKNGQETSVSGVYAVGDIADPFYKQAVTAAADGAKAALQISQSTPKITSLAQAKKALPKQEAPIVIEIQSVEQFQKELEASDVPVFVDFYATWCGPCKRIHPLIEGSAEALSGKVKFLKINVDQMGELSQRYQIRAMPTAIMMDSEGTEIDRKVGSDEISTLLRSLHSD